MLGSRTLGALGAASLLLGLSGPAAAQERPIAISVSGFAGVSVTPLQDVEGYDPEVGFDVRYEDQDVGSAAAFGVQATALRRLSRGGVGLQLDVRHARPRQEAQTVRVVGVEGGEPFDATFDLPRTDEKVTIGTLSVIGRWALAADAGRPDGRLGLFAGLGGGLEELRLALDDETQTRLRDTSFAFTAFAGIEAAFSRRVSAFAEYRLTTAVHHFAFGTELDTTRNTMHHAVAGVRVGL